MWIISKRTSSFSSFISIGRCKSNMPTALPIEFGQNWLVRITYQQYCLWKWLPCTWSPLFEKGEKHEILINRLRAQCPAPSGSSFLSFSPLSLRFPTNKSGTQTKTKRIRILEICPSIHNTFDIDPYLVRFNNQHGRIANIFSRKSAFQQTKIFVNAARVDAGGLLQ